MKCFGRTKSSNFRRKCSRPTRFFVCWQHVWQPLVLLAAVVAFGGGLAELTGVSIRDLWKYRQSNALVLEVSNIRLSNRESCEVVFGLPYLDYPSCVQLPLVVRNPTSTTARNVKVLLKYHGSLAEPYPSDLPSKTIGLGDIPPTDRVTRSVEGLSTTALAFGSINPNRALIYLEPVLWTDTTINLMAASEVPAVRLDVIISAEDREPINHEIWLRAVPASSIQETAESYHARVAKGKGNRVTRVYSPMVLAELNGSRFYIMSEGLRGIKYGEMP
jgi:hypothetical protein